MTAEYRTVHGKTGILFALAGAAARQGAGRLGGTARP